MTGGQKINPIEAMTKIVAILNPFSPEERGRVVRAALTLLGDMETTSVPSEMAVEPSGIGALGNISPRVRSWINQVGLSTDQLEQVFHIRDGEVEVIATVLGKNRKEQTANAYILTGLGQFLLMGNAAFPDRVARSLCEVSGCYDNSNHAAYLKSVGNALMGSKDKGWTLTAPGMKRAADLVKELSKARI